MTRILFFGTILLFFISFSSCLPASRLYYFNDQTTTAQLLDSLKKNTVPTIQKNDRITITISSTDPALTAYLNPFNSASAGGGGNQQTSGYLVDNQGKIEFPLLGKVTVEGINTTEASTLIKEKLSYYYKDLFVNVNLIGKVYFITGWSGAAIPISNERLTIFEALSQTTSLDPYDIKNDVWIIREDSGQRKFAKLNLNSKKIFESPYYYLHNNDLLYVKPSIYSSLLSATSPFKLFITLVGAISAVLILITRI